MTSKGSCEHYWVSEEVTEQILELIQAEVTRRVADLRNMAAMQQHTSGSALLEFGEAGLLTDPGHILEESSWAPISTSPDLDMVAFETPAAQTRCVISKPRRESNRNYRRGLLKKSIKVTCAELQADIDTVIAGSISTQISQPALRVIARDINGVCGKTRIDYQNRSGRTFQDVRKEIIEYMNEIDCDPYSTTPLLAE